MVIDFYTKRLLGPRDIAQRAQWQPQIIDQELLIDNRDDDDDSGNAFRISGNIDLYARRMAARHAEETEFRQDTRPAEAPASIAQPLAGTLPDDPQSAARQLREAAQRLRALAQELRSARQVFAPIPGHAGGQPPFAG